MKIVCEDHDTGDTEPSDNFVMIRTANGAPLMWWDIRRAHLNVGPVPPPRPHIVTVQCDTPSGTCTEAEIDGAPVMIKVHDDAALLEFCVSLQCNIAVLFFALSPMPQMLNRSLRLQGSGFGPEMGSVHVFGAQCDVTTWSDTRVECLRALGAPVWNSVVEIHVVPGMRAALPGMPSRVHPIPPTWWDLNGSTTSPVERAPAVTAVSCSSGDCVDATGVTQLTIEVSLPQMGRTRHAYHAII